MATDIYIPLPPAGTASWKDPVTTAASLPLTGNSTGDARVAEDTQIIYIWTGVTWVAATGGGGVPVGPANTFAGFDTGGLLSNIPNWNVDTATLPVRYGLRYQINDIDPPAGSNYSVTNQFYESITPTVARPDDTEVQLQLNMGLDLANSGVGFGTNGLAARQLDAYLNAPSEAAFGRIENINIGTFLGDTGLSGGSVNSVTNLNIFNEIKAGFTVNQDVSVLGSSVTGAVGAAITGNFQQVVLNSNYLGALSGGFNGVNLVGNLNVTNSPSGGMQSFISGMNFDGDFDYFNVFGDFNQLGNNASTPVTGSYNSISLNPVFRTNSAVRSATYVNVNPVLEAPITDDLNGFSLYLNNGGSGIQAGQSITGINVNLTNADSTTGSVTGVNVTVQGASAGGEPQGPVGIASDGRISVNAPTTLQSGQTFQIGNRIQSLLQVPSGSPVTGTDSLGNNFAGDFLVEDNVALGPLGIGFSSVGFIATMAVAATKTVDAVNVFLPAVSLPDPGFATGGAITDLHMIREFVPLPQGGTLNVTNLYGFKIDSLFGDFSTGATNAWGLYLDTDAQNYVKSSISIGATTVTNSDVALEVGSLKAVLLARMTTTQKNALSAVAGMVVYDTTLNQMSYYNGTTWINV